MGRAIELCRGDGKITSTTNDAAWHELNTVNDEYNISNRHSADAIQLV